MVIVLLLAFCLLVLCFTSRGGQERSVHAWIKGTLVWCGCLLFHIEILSAFNMVKWWTVFVFWAAVDLFLLIWLLKKSRIFKTQILWGRLYNAVVGHKLFTIVFGLMFVYAILTVPYNWDSMTYHLPRIIHWVQNQSVTHYATHNVKQVANPAFHEFICMDIYLLMNNSDIFFNLVQCASFFTNAWIIYEIALKLGCSNKFCRMGVLLFCSMPISFGEALTTQNDHLTGMFLLFFVYYLLDFLKRDVKICDIEKKYSKCIVMAACVGYGYSTKPTVCMGMLFLAFVLLYFCIVRKDSIKILVKLMVMALIVISILILPEMFRNIETFGAIFPSNTGSRQLVGTLNPKYLFINGLKNFSFNLPTIYITNSHIILKNFVCFIAKLLKVDINDPSISEDGREFSLGEALTFGHDTALNSTILIVAVFCLIWCLYRRKKANRDRKTYTYLVMLLFAVCCTFIRWEPFVSRYMLPYLALMCPMASIWIEDISENAKNECLKKASYIVVSWLGITGVLMLFSYHGNIIIKQKVSRPEGYFTNRTYIREEYISAVDTVIESGARNIGLMMGGEYEYPIQYMLKETAERIEDVGVGNDTKKYADSSFIPECIIASKDLGESLDLRNRKYKKILSGENINVYNIEY